MNSTVVDIIGAATPMSALKVNGAGRWMSWISANLPTAIAPVLASAILLIGSTKADNYTVLYTVGAVIAFGAALSTKAICSDR